jgi:hypothetical protein
MNCTRSLLAGAVVSFFGLFFISEIFVRITLASGFWYSHFDFSGDMTSLAEIRDRIQTAAPGGHRLLLLGDSVLGASALTEHRVPEARAKTLFHDLSMEFQGTATHPLNLGADGILLPDIEALSLESASKPPEKVLLLLNFRMFAKDFSGGPHALSRNFLRPDLPPEAQASIPPDPSLTPENQLSDRLYAWMCGHWALFREAQMAKVLWYYPSQKDFFQRVLERGLGQNETQSDILAAALRQKIIPYYQPFLWSPRDIPLKSLRRILDQWARMGIPVTVVLTPQNRQFLGSDLDVPSFEKNRKILAAFLKPYAAKGIVYRDWSGRYPAFLFLDHCHLTPPGNQRYAEDLARLLGKERP